VEIEVLRWRELLMRFTDYRLGKSHALQRIQGIAPLKDLIRSSRVPESKRLAERAVALQTDGESEKKRKSGISHTPMGHIPFQPHPQDSEESPTKTTTTSRTFRRNVYKIPYREVVVVVVLLGASLNHTEGGP